MSDDDDAIRGLFGSESDADEQPAKEQRSSEPGQDALKAAGLADSDDDDDQDQINDNDTGLHDDFDEEEGAPEPEAPLSQRPIAEPQTWTIPLVRRPSEQIHIVNFGSLVDIEPQPFDPQKFQLDDPAEAEGTGRRPRAAILNRLRWRFTGKLDPKTQQYERESNARFIRWSDGSLQLWIGDDYLDVTEQPTDGRSMMLYAFHERDRVLQAQTRVKSRLLVKPPHVASRLHKNMTMNLVPRSGRNAQVKADAELRDYEREHEKMSINEEAELKLRARQEKKTKKSSRRAVYTSFAAPRRNKLTAETLEEDDYYEQESGDEDGEDVEGGTRRYGPRGTYDEDAEEAQERRLLAAKRGSTAPSSRKRRLLDDEDDFDDTELSDDDVEPPAAAKPAKRQVMLDSDDEA